MKATILTSVRFGSASLILPILLEKGVEVEQVIFNDGSAENAGKNWKRKLRKVRRIGLLGALNGIRMRRWYAVDPYRQAGVKDIAEIAREHGISWEIVPAIAHGKTRELIRKGEAEVGLSLGNGYIPENVFSLFPQGMLNIHHEVLPAFKGAQSVIWQLYHGSDKTGFTIHEVEKRIDHGRVLYREELPIQFYPTLRETVSMNYLELQRKSAEALARVLQDLPAYQASGIVQQGGKSYTTPSWKEFRRIRENFKELGREIER